MAGFPHSDIHGSILACSSPWLFAAYRVLLRLLAPRHPPYALSSLTFSTKFTLSCFLVSLLFQNCFLRGIFTSCFLVSLLFQNCFLRGIFTSFLLYTFQGSKCGGDEENRTPDPLLARQVLSQLSYAPIFSCCCLLKYFMVGLSGLEPLTSRLSGVRSNQLSYRPVF